MLNTFEVVKRMLQEKKFNDSSNFIFLIKEAHFNKEQIKELAFLVIETKNPELILRFVKDVLGAPITLLAKAVIATKKANYIYKFAKDIQGAPITLLAKAVIATKDPNYIYKFVKDVLGAPITLLAKAVIVTKDPNYIYKFAKLAENNANIPINELVKGIIATKDPFYIYKFAKLAKNNANIPINKLAHGIIATKDPFYILEFAKYIKKAPINELAHGIITTKNEIYIYFFATDIPNAPIDELVMALIKLQAISYLRQLICDVGTIGFAPETRKKVRSFIEKTIKKETSQTDLLPIQMFLEDSYQNGLIITLKKYHQPFSKKNILQELATTKTGLDLYFLQVYYEYLTTDPPNIDEATLESLDREYLELKAKRKKTNLSLVKEKKNNF